MIEETTQVVQKVITRKQSREAQDGMAVMSLGDHLDELRRRLILAFVGLAPIFLVGLYFGKHIISLLITPMQQALRNEGLRDQMLATGMFETFGAWVMVAFLVTVLAGFPWVLYQAWLFIAPGLYQHERRFVYLLLPLSVTLSVMGAAFMYFVALPAMLTFFVHFTTHLEERSPGVADMPPGIVLPSMPVLKGDPPEPAPGQMWFNENLGQIRICLAMEGKVPKIRGLIPEKSASVVQMTEPSCARSVAVMSVCGRCYVVFVAVFRGPPRGPGRIGMAVR